MKNFLFKFFKAVANSLKRFNLHYTQVTLKTFVAKSSLDDNEKKKNSRTFFLNTKPNNYYSLILLKKLKDFKDINCFKPFLYMDSGLHEIKRKTGRFTNLMGDFNSGKKPRKNIVHIFEFIYNPFEMDDFNLDEVLTIKSEYQPDLNDVPISNGSLGFKRLQKRRKKRRI